MARPAVVGQMVCKTIKHCGHAALLNRWPYPKSLARDAPRTSDYVAQGTQKQQGIDASEYVPEVFWECLQSDFPDFGR